MWTLPINSSLRRHWVCVHSGVCCRKCVEGSFEFISVFFYSSQNMKDVYLKFHQVVFLTPSVAVVSASRIQFEVITLGREDVWNKTTNIQRNIYSLALRTVTLFAFTRQSLCYHTRTGPTFWRGRKPVQTACVAARKVNWSETIILCNVKLVANNYSCTKLQFWFRIW
jgi:hypothetical protein